MQLKDFMQQLEEAVPFSLQEPYDNSGVQVGSSGQMVTRALVALDVTPGVVEEAVRKECDLIVAHHPLIFKGLNRITGDTPAGRALTEAIRHNIAVVAVHTNLDNLGEGVNHSLGEALGLTGMKVLKPLAGVLKKLVTFVPVEHAETVRAALFRAGAGHIGDYDCCSYNLQGKGSFRAGDRASPFVGNPGELHYEEEERIETIFPGYLQQAVVSAMKGAHPYEEVAYDIYPLDNAYGKAGAGMVGYLPERMAAGAFLALVKERLGTPVLRHSAHTGKGIRSVALCGGSGAFLIPDAIGAGADAFVTGDIKYHQFFDAGEALLLVDAGHYETEQCAINLLADTIRKKIVNFALLISETVTNPVKYH